MTTTLVARALSRLDEAIRLYEPSKVIAMFPGGYDSLCATHVTAQRLRFAVSRSAIRKLSEIERATKQLELW